MRCSSCSSSSSVFLFLLVGPSPTLISGWHLGTTTPNPNYPSWGEIGSMGVVTPGLVVLGSLVPTGTKPTTNQRAGSLPPRQTRARRGRRAELGNQLVALLVLIVLRRSVCHVRRRSSVTTYLHRGVFTPAQDHRFSHGEPGTAQEV